MAVAVQRSLCCGVGSQQPQNPLCLFDSKCQNLSFQSFFAPFPKWDSQKTPRHLPKNVICLQEKLICIWKQKADLFLLGGKKLNSKMLPIAMGTLCAKTTLNDGAELNTLSPAHIVL